MATAIDALFVTLGLDTTKFDAAQKKSVENLRKLDEQSDKTNKKLQKGSKELTEGFDKAKNSLASFGAAFLSVGAIKGFIENTTNTNAALGRNAHLLGYSARELKTYGDMMGTVGGTADDFTSSMFNMSQGIAAMSKGDTSFVTALAPLFSYGGNDIIKNGQIDKEALANSLKELVKSKGENVGLNVAQGLGMSRAMFLVFEQGGDAVKNMSAHFDELNAGIEQGTKNATALTTKWNNFTKELESSGNILLNTFNPVLEGTLDILTSIASVKPYKDSVLDNVKNGEWLKSSFQLGALDFLGSIYARANGVSNKELAESLGGGDTNKSTNNNKFSALEKKYGLEAGMLSRISKIESNGNPNAVSNVGATGERARGEFQFLPSTEKQYGGRGAEQAAQFLHDLLLSHHGNVDEALASYNWGSGNVAKYGMDSLPKETRDYLKKYHAMTGAGIGLSNNGQSGVNNTSTVNIKNLTVTTQATDANGIAKSLPQALQDNAMIGAGVGGNK